MPKRPPKQWWSDCVEGVEEGGSADDPESVCGSLWYHKMSTAEKRAATKRHENPEELEENPTQFESGLLLGAAALIVVGWILKKL